MRSLGYLIKEGLRNVWVNRTMTISSIAVLMSCLLLTGAAGLFSLNVNRAMGTLEGNNSIRVYVRQDVSSLDALRIGDEIRKLDNVESCEFVSKDEGMQEMRELLGEENASLLDGLEGDDNWLPDSFRISMKDLSQYDETAREIQAIDGVDSIYDYSDLANQLTRIDNIVTRVGLVIVIALSVVSLFIIANTIRVAMLSRRLEISIMKSVGATNGFIRVPFIVEGIVLGLVAGLVSSLLLDFIYYRVIDALGIDMLFRVINIHHYLLPMVLAFMLVGALFGALGGAISIGRFLKREGGAVVGW